MITVDSSLIIAFETPQAFEKWLHQNHNISLGIWLKIYKKDSGVKTITYAEALDAALCYGWIDGQKKSHDTKAWIQKFCARKPKSIWSKINKGHTERLIAEGRMHAAGLLAINKAKEDGRWEQAYDSPKNMTIPDGFLKALSKNKKAFDFFNTLNKANLFAIGFKLQTAKKQETKDKRTKEIIEMLANGLKFH
jgi:uncharacterized protein YdeI (YjbR/CyaY-like superfamily)